MEARSVVSNKQQLITALEQVYSKASSEEDFYKQIQEKDLKIYSRNDIIVGIKLKRKFRFKTLGYDKTILQELNKNLSQNKRLNTIKRIREYQQQQQSKARDGSERTRKRGR